MIVVRATKISLVAAIALCASLVASGNLSDYNTNFVFVEHVLSMDTIYPFSTIKYRAVTNPALQHTAYIVIIITQVIIAVLCWIGAISLMRNIRADAGLFNRRKTFATLGLTLGFLLWQVGFMSIGGEWFGMWQSQQWNGVPSAFRFVIAISVVLILVSMPDYDIERQSRSSNNGDRRHPQRSDDRPSAPMHLRMAGALFGACRGAFRPGEFFEPQLGRFGQVQTSLGNASSERVCP